MTSSTVAFLIVGGIGVAILALGLLGSELLSFGHVDVDGPVSVEVVAGFVGAFGFVAAIACELLGATTPVETILAAAIGVFAAFPTGYLAFRLSRAARNMHTDATPTRADLVGCLGVVVTAIPAGGFGEVRVILGGQPVKLNARSGGAVPMGTQIFVIDAPTDTSVIVEETQSIPELGSHS